MDVVERLFHVSGLRVIGLICDGASEHTKFFRIVLHGTASQDVMRSVHMNHPCDESTKIFAISDVPHLIKKGRGYVCMCVHYHHIITIILHRSLLRSGQRPWSTRRMLFDRAGDSIEDGDLLTWDPLSWIHENRNKKNAAGQERSK